jgi:tetratricopeptide (TPR) repeat protein
MRFGGESIDRLVGEGDQTMRGVRHLGTALAGSMLLATVAVAAVSPSQLEKAHRLCERGFEVLDSGNPARAETFFQKALKLVPSYPDGHVGLGHVAMTEQRYEAALQEYLKAREGYVELADFMFDIEMKQFYLQQGKLPKLQQELVRVQTGEEQLPESERRWRVSVLREKIRDLQAMQPPGKESSVEPPGKMHFYVGNAMSRLGRWSEAVLAFESCVERSPKFSQAYNNLALAYWRSGRIEEAVDSLHKAEDLGFKVNPRFKADLEQSLQKKEEGEKPARERS